ncbi:MAG: nitrophenyl compound nitroreductase subunit ArsF family protein [Kiritimatiellia bacterium]
MTYKSAIKFLLLVFVATSVVFLVIQETRQKNAPVSAAGAIETAAAAEPAQFAKTESGQKILAYYFFTTVRCPTCRKIEAFSHEALREGFSDALRSGVLEWHPVNVQLPENRHFINDYQLFTKSLVIVRVEAGKQVEWKNLEKVWELTGNKQAFLRYVQDEVGSYLRKG